MFVRNIRTKYFPAILGDYVSRDAFFVEKKKLKSRWSLVCMSCLECLYL